MDPTSKLLIGEMKKLGNRFALVESRVDSLEGFLGDRFKLVEQSANNLVAWQPGIDATIADLTTKLGSVDDVKLSWIMSTSCMVCQPLSSRIVIGYSPVICGRNCLIWLEFSCG